MYTEKDSESRLDLVSLQARMGVLTHCLLDPFQLISALRFLPDVIYIGTHLRLSYERGAPSEETQHSELF